MKENLTLSKNKARQRVVGAWAALLLTVLLGSASGCNLPQETIDALASLDVTQAYQTVDAMLTEAAPQMSAVIPTSAPTDSGLPTETPTPAPAPATFTPVEVSLLETTPASTVACDLAAPGNPIDITIPDDTLLNDGEAFTKVWRLQNIGACTWTKSYRIELFSGDAMGAPPSVAMPEEVLPGSTVDIAVDMVAPQAAGTYQGNWKLRNAHDAWFGIGPDGSSSFWVRVVVIQSPTSTATAPTPTFTPTPTATPAVQASGPAILHPGDMLDLDMNQAYPENGEDLSYESNAEGQHLLVPLGNVLLGVHGDTRPTQADCQADGLPALPLVVEDLSIPVFLCYRTNLGLPGWALVSDLNVDDFTLSLEIYTWSLP